VSEARGVEQLAGVLLFHSKGEYWANARSDEKAVWLRVAEEELVRRLPKLVAAICNQERQRVRESLEERREDERSQQGEMHVWRASAFGDAIADLVALEDSNPQPDSEDRGEEPPCTCDNNRYPEGQGGCEVHNPVPTAPPEPQGDGEWPGRETWTVYSPTGDGSGGYVAEYGNHLTEHVGAILVVPADPEPTYTLSEIRERLLGEGAVDAAMDAVACARRMRLAGDPPPTQRGIEAAYNHAFNTEQGGDDGD
jgi:hypothetical protein